MFAFTAAHKTLPFGLRFLTVNQKNHKKVMVRINNAPLFHSGGIVSETVQRPKGESEQGLSRMLYCCGLISALNFRERRKTQTVREGRVMASSV